MLLLRTYVHANTVDGVCVRARVRTGVVWRVPVSSNLNVLFVYYKHTILWLIEMIESYRRFIF